MATGLALVVLFLLAVILLLLIDRAGLKAESDAKDSLLGQQYTSRTANCASGGSSHERGGM